MKSSLALFLGDVRRHREPRRQLNIFIVLAKLTHRPADLLETHNIMKRILKKRKKKNLTKLCCPRFPYKFSTQIFCYLNFAFLLLLLQSFLVKFAKNLPTYNNSLGT